MFWRTNETDSAGRPSLHGRLVRLDARRDDPIGAASQGGLVCLMLEASGLDDRKRQEFLKHALQLQPYWLKFGKEDSDAGFSAYGNDQKGLEMDTKTWSHLTRYLTRKFLPHQF